jgi:hypothetical protein
VTDRAIKNPLKHKACDVVTAKIPQGPCPHASPGPSGRKPPVAKLLEPQILRPFNRSEVLSIAEAAHLAGRSERTIRDWCLLNDIGRRIGGRWAVSRVALAMFLDGDREALASYLGGDRTSPAVTTYFERCGLPLPKPARAA